MFTVGWVRHVVCAVTHRACRQALIKKCLVVAAQRWWVTAQNLRLTHPTFEIKQVLFSPGLLVVCSKTPQRIVGLAHQLQGARMQLRYAPPRQAHFRCDGSKIHVIDIV